MIEGASLPMVAVFYMIMGVNPSEAAGGAISNETIIVNTLVMLFFEVVIADYAVAKMSEHYQRKDPNSFIDVEVVYARRKKSTYMVAGYMLMTLGVMSASAIMTGMCTGYGVEGTALLSRCALVNSTAIP